MNYYQEITLLPNTDITLYFIWEKLYRQIHFVLVENKTGHNQSDIGVAFPEYNAEKYHLGTKLRLFAENKNSLEKMLCRDWLDRLKDYVHLSEIRPVPDKLEGHANFRHIKLKGNKEKLARRRAQRKGETFKEALAHFDRFVQQRSNLPYINMRSETTNQFFHLFIEKRVVNSPQQGTYSCYGLSHKATVPLF